MKRQGLLMLAIGRASHRRGQGAASGGRAAYHCAHVENDPEGVSGESDTEMHRSQTHAHFRSWPFFSW